MKSRAINLSFASMAAVMLWLVAGSRAETLPHAITPVVSIVPVADLGPAARHGLVEIERALTAKGVAFERAASLPEARSKAVLILGRKGVVPPAGVTEHVDTSTFAQVPEALAITKVNAPNANGWFVWGADDRGLMYAALDVADRIAWSNDAANPLAELRQANEQPAVRTRAVSIYTFHRRHWEDRFYNEDYWARYLDNLARNRFNALVVIFGYENGGFLAPCYPYFFDTEGFPNVKMIGITPQEQAKNLAALRRLIDMAHARGLKLTIGIWDHIYRGGVQAGGVPGAEEAVGTPTRHLVTGVDADNLVPYTKAALAEFVRRVPGVDAIQFRMHWESGLRRSEQEGFWRDVFAMLKLQAPDLHLELRAKDLPDSVIQSAIDTGIDFRITTKYWMEQMGLPFHPTHVNRQDQGNRRHGYADLLRYPKKYPIHFRMFNGGTTRVLLWGDPEYGRRFAKSCRLWDGEGFEINEPLISKMAGQTHDTPPFDLLNEPHRYYDDEFERYWHFFQTFGRMGYNPETPADVWEKEFERRFGAEAGPLVAAALHRASWVLPRIVASNFTYREFPLTNGWPEKQRFRDLPYFSRAQGSDIELFANFDEEAQLLIDGGETAKVRPPQTSRWFRETAEEIERLVAEAERRVGKSAAADNKEFDSTIADLKILANLSRYHARRIPAAVSYRLYMRTRDVAALDEAIRYEREAIEAWRQLVAAAGDFYANDLMMGARSHDLCGHWRDELAAMERDLRALEARRAVAATVQARRPAPKYRPLEGEVVRATVEHEPVTAAAAVRPLVISARVAAPAGVKWVRLRYRSLNQTMDYRTLPMVAAATDGETDRYQATVPAEHLNPEWDFMYFIEVMDNAQNGTHYPDFEQESPYIVTTLTR